VKKLILTTVLFSLSLLLFGEAQSLSLNEARELALHNSRSLARFNLNIQSRILAEKTLGFRNLPSLSLSARAGTVLFAWEEGTSADVIRDNFYARGSAGVRQRLWDWDGGEFSIRRAIAELNTELARHSALAEYYSVLNSVDSLYYAVLEAQAGLEAA
jgi:outer membrane protein TolC